MEGAYIAQKKNGEIYYRSSINIRTHHISLGGYDTEEEAHSAYMEAARLRNDSSCTIDNFRARTTFLPYDKAVSIINLRDNGIYIPTPIYMRKDYLSYFLHDGRELKFDTDDLFYYSGHRILTRGGSFYVNDYGSQYRVLSRYGVKKYAVPGRDYAFANGDRTDMRRANIIIYSHYHGVIALREQKPFGFEARIHLNGDFRIGIYNDEIEAAIAYNKAVDYVKNHLIKKTFPQNYIESIRASEYAQIYSRIILPEHFRAAVEYFLKQR